VDHDENFGNPGMAAMPKKIYRLLEEQVIPLHYKVSENGVPLGWVRLIKETMKRTAAAFSARRMAQQNIKKFHSSSIQKALE
jgi:starch phosphorylase